MTIERALEIRAHAAAENWDFTPVEGLQAVNKVKQLQAAAPDLLEALQFYVSICGNTCHSVTRETALQMYEKAQSAITKATADAKEGK
jgi:hypothetical protein